MRVPRFKTLLMELLEAKAAEHPGIQEIGTYQVPTQENPVIQCADGTKLYLTIVGSAPPGGDDHSAPEKVVTREEGTPIVITNRGES